MKVIAFKIFQALKFGPYTVNWVALSDARFAKCKIQKVSDFEFNVSHPDWEQSTSVFQSNLIGVYYDDKGKVEEIPSAPLATKTKAAPKAAAV